MAFGGSQQQTWPTCAVLALPHLLFIFIWLWPRRFERLCRPLGDAVTVFAAAANALKRAPHAAPHCLLPVGLVPCSDALPFVCSPLQCSSSQPSTAGTPRPGPSCFPPSACRSGRPLPPFSAWGRRGGPPHPPLGRPLRAAPRGHSTFKPTPALVPWAGRPACVPSAWPCCGRFCAVVPPGTVLDCPVSLQALNLGVYRAIGVTGARPLPQPRDAALLLM